MLLLQRAFVAAVLVLVLCVFVNGGDGWSNWGPPEDGAALQRGDTQEIGFYVGMAAVGAIAVVVGCRPAKTV